MEKLLSSEVNFLTSLVKKRLTPFMKLIYSIKQFKNRVLESKNHSTCLNNEILL